MFQNFKFMCRLCMKQNDTLKLIFPKKDEGSLPSFPIKIRYFVPSLKIVRGDGLPDKLCEDCATQVEISYKFKLQCESSDNSLRESLNNHKKQVELLENEQETKNKILIKPEVKEEFFLDENNDGSYSKEGFCNDNIPESSNDSWPDFPVETSSSKADVEIKIPKSETPSASPKVTAKRKKKSVKVESLTSTEGDKKSIFTLGSESLPLDVKVEDINVDKELNLKKPTYVKMFQCHDCGKNFAKKAQLVLHMSGHTGAKPYICNQCCRTFASRINLKKHLFTHTGEKPYLCTHCGVFFGRIDTLTKHMRSHTGEKPFNCNICGNNFARRSTFTNHMRTHSGEKPYLCTECGWRCVQSYDLKKHMRCHTGEKPYHCSVCRMSFGQRNSLTKHMRCHIGEVPIPMECVKEMQFRCQVYGPKEFGNFSISNNQSVDGSVQ